MNKKFLFQAVGGIDNDLIIEAGNAARKVRRIRISKITAFAAALVLLLSLTAWASSVILGSRSIHSSNIPDYYNAPSPKTLQNDIGIAPKIIESFSNGYSFESGVISENEDYDADGSVFESYKGFSCKYKNGGSSIFMHVDAAALGNQMDDNETAAKYKGAEIKYHAYTNKLVPGNYELTEQDRADERSGKYVFSYGSSEVEIIEVQILGWEYNELNYTLCAMDSLITKDGLVQMAKEMIDFQTEVNLNENK